MKKIIREVKSDKFRLVFFIEDLATINRDDERSLTKQPVFFFCILTATPGILFLFRTTHVVSSNASSTRKQSVDHV